MKSFLKLLTSFVLLIFVNISSSKSDLNLELDVDKLENSNNYYLQEKINVSATRLTAFDKKILQKEIIRKIRASGKIITNPEVSSYIQELGNKISENNKIIFLVLNNPQVNASAILGDVITINSGLILISDKEGELAGVVAHEIAHVNQRHVERIIASLKDKNFLSLQRILLAISILGLKNDPTLSYNSLGVLAGITSQKITNYTRSQEEEADAIGLKLLEKSGYNSNDMVDMFEKLSNSKKYSTSMPEYLRTHPLGDSRIVMIKNLVNKKNEYKKINNQSFLTIKAILKLNNNMTFTSQDLKHQAFRVALAIRLLKSKSYSKVQTLIEDINYQKPPKSIYLKLLIGEFYLKYKKPKQAIKWFKLAYKQNSKNIAAIIRLADNLLNKNNKLAFDILKKAKNNFATHPEIYRLIAKYYLLKNQKSYSYFYLAQSDFYSGNTEGALQKLFLAKGQNPENPYLAAKIDGRFKEYQSILKVERIN